MWVAGPSCSGAPAEAVPVRSAAATITVPAAILVDISSPFDCSERITAVGRGRFSLLRQPAVRGQQPVAHERCDCGGVVGGLSGGDGAQRRRPPLAERTLETRLLAQRLVAFPARGAAGGERALGAAGDAREADRRAQVEQ